MLEINLAAVITQAIAFILLVLFLGKFVLRPVREVIDNRQQEIQGTLDQIAADRRAMFASRCS